MRIENLSGFPHLCFEKAGYRSVIYDVLVLRGTFDFAADGKPIKFASAQRPVVLADVLEGPAGEEPLRSVLKTDGDLLLTKLATDFHVVGHACAEKQIPQKNWFVGVRLGELAKVVQVCGPRYFKLGLWDWKVSEPEPTSRVALDYRLAFGGGFSASDSAGQHSAYHPSNPAGCGWLPNAEDLASLSPSAQKSIKAQISALSRLDAPQIEDIKKPIQSPHERYPLEGFGPIARWWAPRTSLTGTLDDAWRAERYPAVPDDFDLRYYQSAHPGLIYPGYVKGDEVIKLTGCLSEGLVAMRLPALKIIVKVKTDSGVTHLAVPNLDTVAVDLDKRQVGLTWRLTLAQVDRAREVRINLVGPTSAALNEWKQSHV